MTNFKHGSQQKLHICHSKHDFVHQNLRTREVLFLYSRLIACCCLVDCLKGAHALSLPGQVGRARSLKSPSSCLQRPILPGTTCILFCAAASLASFSIKHNQSYKGALPAQSLHVKPTGQSFHVTSLSKQGDGFGHARSMYACRWVPFLCMSESAALFLQLPAYAYVSAFLCCSDCEAAQKQELRSLSYPC